MKLKKLNKALIEKSGKTSLRWWFDLIFLLYLKNFNIFVDR